MEVEQLERDDARIQVDFQIRQSHWQRNHRAGLSIWIGLFTDRVEGNEEPLDAPPPAGATALAITAELPSLTFETT
ncbi:MAG: hypothetical protein ABEK29_06825 [Bradymonadaceae bacterium]